MPRVSAEVLIPVVVTVIIVVSLVSLAQPTSALDTVVTAPDEVTKHDPIEITVVVTSTAEESADVESYTLELTLDGADESVQITFGPDGDVLSVDPPRGAVGDGDIRVNRLRRDLTIDAEMSANDTGYGYGYGYGYGDGETTFTFDVVLPSSAFKHGDYIAGASANTANQTGVGASTNERFSVLVPAGSDPPTDDNPPKDDHRDERPDVDRPNRGQFGGFGEVVFGGPDRNGMGSQLVARFWFVFRVIAFGGI